MFVHSALLYIRDNITVDVLHSLLIYVSILLRADWMLLNNCCYYSIG